MQTACIHCGAEHLLKDGQFGGHSKVQFKCSKCGKATIVEIKRRVDSTVVMSSFFFFSSRRRHTRLLGDWSSDVCSSDLMRRHARLLGDWSSDVCSSDLPSPKGEGHFAPSPLGEGS